MNKISLCTIVVCMTACLTPSVKENSDDTDAESTVFNTIEEVQTGVVAEGETVTIQNAVITSGLTSDEAGFFIQDEGGGEWSGIYVFVGQAGGDINPLVGDKITITGVVSEYYDSTQIVLSNADGMTVTGEADVVATVVSDVSDWEPYEGVMVTLEQQEVESDVNSYGEVELSGGISMDNLFFNFNTEFGATYSSVSGVITYSFEQYKLCPTSEDDLQGYVAGEGPAVLTVAEVQSGDYEGRTVAFENVVVTDSLTGFQASSDSDGYTVFWVQDEGGGEWSGLYVFVRNNTAAEISINRGDVLNLSGSIEERYDQTQLVLADAGNVEVVSSDGTPTPVVLTESPADWENYEGVLVTLQDASIGAGGSYGQYAISNFSGIKLDDEIYQAEVEQGDAIAALTGLVYYSYGEFTILPREAGDVGEISDGPDVPATTATITECRDGSVALESTVTIDTGVVTAVSSTKVYIQDPSLSSDAGLVLYFGSTTFAANVGDLVSVTGTLTEFYDVLQVSVSDSSDFSVTGPSTVSPVVLTSVPSDWEAYESMWVTLENVTVSAGPDSNGNFDTDWGIMLSDYWLTDLASYVSVDSVYNVTGIVNYYGGSFEVLTGESTDISAQ